MIEWGPLLELMRDAAVDPAAISRTVHTTYGTQVVLPDGSVTRPTRGQRTGSPDAPALLNLLITQLLGKVADEWMQQGHGWGG